MNETELVFTRALSCSRTELYTGRSRRPNADQASFVTDALRRRMRGEPLAYILGSVEFMGFEFAVDARVLVPRQETEILVEQVLRWSTRAQEHTSTGRSMLEIGTGSGCIAVSLAKLLPQAMITATDISQDALAVASANAARLGVTGKVEFVRCDLFPPGRERFDCIVSNPPYVRSAEIDALSPEVRSEPRLALDGGADGLDFYRRLIPQAADRLFPEGVLAVEVGYGQSAAVRGLIEGSKLFAAQEVVRDYNGIERVLVARRSSRFHSSPGILQDRER